MLKNRLAHHTNGARLHSDMCTLAHHLNNFNHKINYSDVKILPNYKKRLFLDGTYFPTTFDEQGGY